MDKSFPAMVSRATMFGFGGAMRRLWAMDERGRKRNDSFMLWVDAVGGYWVCLADAVTLGQPGPGPTADVPILADLSACHARVRRDGEGYLIEALTKRGPPSPPTPLPGDDRGIDRAAVAWERGATCEVRVDGRLTPQVAALHSGCRIELGGSVRLRFRRPHALSGTARLDYASTHRTQPTSDAVLLMADSLVLGPKSHSHVVCRNWTHEVILYRHDDALFCRCAAGLLIDGVSVRDRGPLKHNSRVEGDGFSFSLEAIERF
jgi:hypothetical protein